MTHDQAFELLLDHREGRLDAASAAGVASHLDDCDDCTELLETYDTLVVGAADDHPSVERLVAHAEGELDEAVARHARDCPSCAEQLDAVRGASAEAAGALPFRRPARSGARRVAFAAASVAALLALAVGWLALVRLPDVEGQLVALRDRVTGAPGAGAAVALPLFRGSLRGDETGPTIAIGAGDTLVPLALTPNLPADLPDPALVRLELGGPAGTAVYSVELAAGRVRELSAASGAMAWMVPAALLEAGPHTLRAVELGSGDVLLEQPFTIERSGGDR